MLQKLWLILANFFYISVKTFSPKITYYCSVKLGFFKLSQCVCVTNEPQPCMGSFAIPSLVAINDNIVPQKLKEQLK